MNDIDHLLTLCLFPPFSEHILLLRCIRREENVINAAAPYSGQHSRLTLFTMYASVCFLSRGVEERPQFIMNSEYNCSNREPKLC